MSPRTASTEAPIQGNRRLDLNDLCRLKAKPSLLGIVNRTHHDVFQTDFTLFLRILLADKGFPVPRLTATSLWVMF
jgi:hypothetical protein